MDNKKDLLLASAARLYSLGVDLEAARARLRDLVRQELSYDSEEMQRAYTDYAELDRQWKALEQEYLSLREELCREKR